ncbi:hypothetical protein D8674_030827 [Pyrus ussuriensis x Pyrus communis]|uniref:Uncharacterized protein n=1 Tax=Pyrus ussuriensis x Pyrus communis TaxID=2448454 RepID=A0A5N5EXB2_9ROSA|nr:hypothetical protein D8674_030827 [Pyrus ussuriensis x Pyrus communis]
MPSKLEYQCISSNSGGSKVFVEGAMLHRLSTTPITKFLVKSIRSRRPVALTAQLELIPHDRRGLLASRWDTATSSTSTYDLAISLCRTGHDVWFSLNCFTFVAFAFPPPPFLGTCGVSNFVLGFSGGAAFGPKSGAADA